MLEQGRLDGSARFDLCTDSAESNRNFRAIAGGWRRGFAGFPTCFPRGGSLFGHCAFRQRGHSTASSSDAKDATGKPRRCAVGKPR